MASLTSTSSCSQLSAAHARGERSVRVRSAGGETTTILKEFDDANASPDSIRSITACCAVMVTLPMSALASLEIFFLGSQSGGSESSACFSRLRIRFLSGSVALVL